ncbi:TIGR04282 family arsenosugar biosynthesis glycosyltransferase [Curtobacterium ammoniigenes]|uniref:TIGR04282 family arsenosugar biosynthesis glycosyltransferase n=1 Tax=Curtobacterium ammoniigenes TaxID=395387 RepID=UPI0008337112|nr:DUF2064 domain-containing protein [Curtobacterium ammoniigenes]
MSAVVIVAKECLPGRVKTRLGRSIGMDAAARVASASLEATMRTARSLPFDRRILLYDGTTPPAGSEDFEILPQVAGDLDERLGAMFDVMDEPTLLVGMDTPQWTADHVAPILASAANPAAYDTNSAAHDTDPATSDADAANDVDAWIGLAADGGFWALWLRDPDGALTRGVPMSRSDTGRQQLAALRARGLRVEHLPQLVDVDELEDARTVAATMPGSDFAITLQHAAAHNDGTPATATTGEAR